jgi:hypothetical protein
MSQEIYDNLGCQTLPQDCGQSGVVWRVNDARMRAWRIGLRFLSDNRHNVGIGTVSVKVIRQTRPDSVTEQMAEQEDSAATEADLEQSGAFALDPHNLVTNGFDNPPARLGQLWFGTDMQDGSGAAFHESYDVIKKEGLVVWSASVRLDELMRSVNSASSPIRTEYVCSIQHWPALDLYLHSQLYFFIPHPS